METAVLWHGPAHGRALQFESLPYVIEIPVLHRSAVSAGVGSTTGEAFTIARYERSGRNDYLWEKFDPDDPRTNAFGEEGMIRAKQAEYRKSLEKKRNPRFSTWLDEDFEGYWYQAVLDWEDGGRELKRFYEDNHGWTDVAPRWFYENLDFRVSRPISMAWIKAERMAHLLNLIKK